MKNEIWPLRVHDNTIWIGFDQRQHFESVDFFFLARANNHRTFGH